MVKALAQRRHIALDTSPFIYFIEGHDLFGPASTKLFEGIEAGRFEAITSALTLLEVLVAPYRVNNLTLRDRYYDSFTRFPGLRMIGMDVHIADLAARLRGRYGLKTSDAIQVATAISEKAEVFITNDRELLRVTEIKVITLADD